MTRNEIIQLQRDLNARGYGPLVIDGRYGQATASAYQEFLAITPAPPAAKPWWTSRAQVGWILAIGLNLLSRWLGVELDADAWIPAILEVLSGISAIVGLYGNTKREAPIDQTLVAPGLRLPARRVSDKPVPPNPDRAARSNQTRHDDFWSNGGLGGFGSD